MKTIPLPQCPKARLFAECQESIGKDVERALGVLQARFAIIRGLARNMDKAELGMIMKACVICHNMIVEDERDSFDLAFDYGDVEDNTLQPNVQQTHHPCYAAYLRRVAEMHNPALTCKSPIRPCRRNMESTSGATKLTTIGVKGYSSFTCAVFFFKMFNLRHLN